MCFLCLIISITRVLLVCLAQSSASFLADLVSLENRGSRGPDIKLVRVSLTFHKSFSASQNSASPYPPFSSRFHHLSFIRVSSPPMSSSEYSWDLTLTWCSPELDHHLTFSCPYVTLTWPLLGDLNLKYSWPSPDIHLTFTWPPTDLPLPPDHHLPFPCPLPNFN